MDFKGQDWIGDMLNSILIEVLGSMAEQERKKIRKRQREGIEAMKRRGEWIGMDGLEAQLMNLKNFCKKTVK